MADHRGESLIDRLARTIDRSMTRRTALGGGAGLAAGIASRTVPARARGRREFTKAEQEALGLTLPKVPVTVQARCRVKRESCSDTRVCCDGLACTNGVCKRDRVSTAGNVGDSCSVDTDCAGDLTCQRSTCQCRQDLCFVREWGGIGYGRSKFTYPFGVAVDQSNGSVYVADTGNNRIQKFDARGAFITEWGELGGGNGEFFNPVGVAVSDDGVYVIDRDNARVQQFDASGAFTREWGSEGRGTGSGSILFFLPSGISVDASGKVYVADTGNEQVQVFSATGTRTNVFSIGRGDLENQFRSPTGVAVLSTQSPFNGQIAVSDFGNNRVQLWDTPDNESAVRSVTTTATGSAFDRPFGVGTNFADYWYVADTFNNRVVAYDGRNNSYGFQVIGTSGSQSLSKPRGVAGKGSMVYVADTWNHKIKVWAIGN